MGFDIEKYTMPTVKSKKRHVTKESNYQINKNQSDRRKGDLGILEMSAIKQMEMKERI